MNFSDWLNRKPSGPAPKRPIKRTTPVRKVSRKRAKEGRQYTVQRRAYLEANATCHACQTAPSVDVHHRSGRYGGNYLNEATWAALCRACHDNVHRNPKEAEARGLLDRSR